MPLKQSVTMDSTLFVAWTTACVLGADSVFRKKDRLQMACVCRRAQRNTTSYTARDSAHAHTVGGVAQWLAAFVA